jgi:hypothetical protein
MAIQAHTPEETVRAYIEAWNSSDDVARRKLLDECWAEDGAYLDPSTELHGRDALSAHIGRFVSEGAYGRGPGCRIPISSGVDYHHGMLRFTWVLLDPDGKPVSAGTDFGELAPDNRLQRIVGFFGPPPQVPDGWPARLVWQEA